MAWDELHDYDARAHRSDREAHDRDRALARGDFDMPPAPRPGIVPPPFKAKQQTQEHQTHREYENEIRRFCSPAELFLFQNMYPAEIDTAFRRRDTPQAVAEKVKYALKVRGDDLSITGTRR
jgi:hypothetical protein